MVATVRRTSAVLRGALAALVFACASPAAPAREARHDVVDVDAEHLDAEYWIGRAKHADGTLLDEAAIARINAALRAHDASVNALERLPANVTRAQVREWVSAISAWPERALFDARGAAVDDAKRAALERAAALDAIAASREVRFGLVVRRASLRAFPTRERVFFSADDRNIDRFQESALFPGTPVAVVHESAEGSWLFVVSPLYEAWIEREHVALGARDAVLGYPKREPALVVTGAKVRTVYTPEEPRVSELQLDMGVRLPRRDDWPADRPVHGQHPYTNHVVELPVRNPDGTLAFAPALVPRTADVATDYLPLTRANVLRQGFKFLGERYGWGHDYNARDCSGFVSEVYRSFGVALPRNTKDQAVSPAYDRIAFDPAMSRAERERVLKTLDVGDLVYIPGHVMMVIGHDRAGPYVIHDTVGIGYLDAQGEYRRVTLNGVSVTPLLPLYAGEDTPTIDRITAIQRIRPASEPRS